MRVHPWLVLGSLLLVTASSEGGPLEPIVDTTHRGGITATTRVPVLVYSTVSDLSGDDQRAALAVADDALSTASVDIAWVLCPPGACRVPSPGALKIRIVESPDSAGRSSNILGQALVDARTGTGVLATVFIDRTRRLAGELGIDHQALLGRAIAHELGHLLLATPTHGNAGLMRANWSRDELLGARRDDWTFTPLDAAAIRDRLARLRGGSRRAS